MQILQRIPVAVAAAIMGTGVTFIKNGLKHGALPFGTATSSNPEKRGARYSYHNRAGTKVFGGGKVTQLDWKISKALRRMQRRREKHMAMRIACKLSAVVLLMGAAVMFSGAASQPEPMGRITVEHTVQEGETLWSIAETHCGDVYIMEYLHELRENNPSVQSGRIYPGQIIRLTY